MKTLRLKPCFTQNWEAQKRVIKKTLFNLCQHINRQNDDDDDDDDDDGDTLALGKPRISGIWDIGLSILGPPPLPSFIKEGGG